jgi:triacylglycerol lipase
MTAWLGCAGALAFVFGIAQLAAQVPPGIAAQNRALGTRIDVPAAIRTYTPVEEQPPYPAAQARITREIAYGDNPRYRLDVFAPPERGKQLRPVIIFATGGDFTRRIDLPGGAPFYDNVVLWAARHGLVGVNTDRRPLRGGSWQNGPEDMKAIIGWVHAHIADYGGDPNRVIFLGHAYGSTQLLSYLAHPQYWCCGGPGIIGATVISAPLNLPPATSPPAAPAPGARGSGAGTRAGVAAPAVGVTGRQPRLAGPNPLFDPQHSDLDGLSNIRIPIFIGAAQFEGEQQKQSERVLQQRLCALGHCPTYRLFKDHNHLSVMFSFNTPDASVSGPVLDWIARTARVSGSSLASN